MPTKEHEVALDDHARNWLRIKFTREDSEWIAFLAQYEIAIGDERLPVVRYDGVHGFAHRDVLNRRGDVIDKWILPDAPSFREALLIGEQDIRENWRHYRENFLRGQQ